jgi:hypothetical protein
MSYVLLHMLLVLFSAGRSISSEVALSLAYILVCLKSLQHATVGQVPGCEVVSCRHPIKCTLTPSCVDAGSSRSRVQT